MLYIFPPELVSVVSSVSQSRTSVTVCEHTSRFTWLPADFETRYLTYVAL